MRAWVVDASAVVSALLDPTENDEVAQLLADAGNDVVAPHLIDVEVLSVLRRLVLRSALDVDRASMALALLGDLPVRRFDHTPLLPRAFALRDNFSSYDAVYVTLAEALGATLVTADLRLSRAVARWIGSRVLEVGV